MVATAGPCKSKKTVEALQQTATQVQTMTPQVDLHFFCISYCYEQQVINAGSIKLHQHDSAAAEQHFDNMRREYADALQRLRALVDEAIDTVDFVRATGECHLLSTLHLHSNVESAFRLVLFITLSHKAHFCRGSNQTTH